MARTARCADDLSLDFWGLEKLGDAEKGVSYFVELEGWREEGVGGLRLFEHGCSLWRSVEELLVELGG